jgi:choline dehydrogenase-like flavoprotein
MIYVVGSGPAGVSAAHALLDQGLRVTMLDAGFELEPQRKAAISALQQIDSSQWRGQRVEFLKENVAPDHKGVGLKYAYGSDFPYRGAEQLVPFRCDNAATAPSLARGGFSNVWGSSVLPYRAEDITDWPITLDELAPHYRGVLDWMDLSAATDDLAKLFPLYTDHPDPLRPSSQATALLQDMGRNRAALHQTGVHFGASRVAVRASARNGKPGCTYCGLCMYGCPHELIFNSSAELPRLIGDPNFTYRSGVVVTRVEESGGQVRLSLARVPDGMPIESEPAERVYLACGAVSTSRLLLQSLDAFDQPITLRDSCYYLVPLVRFRGAPQAATEPLHTLAQAFIEITDPAVSPRTVHLQIYTYNDMYEGAIRKMLGPAYGLAKGVINRGLGRLLVAQGYLHSDYSRSMTLTLQRHAGPTGTRLVIAGEKAGDVTRQMLARVMNKLASNWRRIGAVPAIPMLHLPPPGRGFHSGGSFPMREDPGKFESDVLGRASGFKRVHVVDSTVLPTIPATTITFTVMANARRIASRHNEV